MAFAGPSAFRRMSHVARAMESGRSAWWFRAKSTTTCSQRRSSSSSAATGPWSRYETILRVSGPPKPIRIDAIERPIGPRPACRFPTSWRRAARTTERSSIPEATTELAALYPCRWSALPWAKKISSSAGLSQPRTMSRSPEVSVLEKSTSKNLTKRWLNEPGRLVRLLPSTCSQHRGPRRDGIPSGRPQSPCHTCRKFRRYPLQYGPSPCQHRRVGI